MLPQFPPSPLTSALIGATGFVGQTLQRQRPFDALFHSRNIAELAGQSFDLIVCAGAPAEKWKANADPAGDFANLRTLMTALEQVRCREFILISTVDVFSIPAGVTEETPPEPAGLHPYGLHRFYLEELVRQTFTRHLVVRLPGLVGPGLKKNVIYDLTHRHRLEAIDTRGVFQFYPLVNLWPDIQAAREAELSLLHLTAEPLKVADLAREGFGWEFVQEPATPAPVPYDVRTIHAGLRQQSQSRPYQYSRAESLLAIRAYAQAEWAQEKEA